MWGTGRVCTEPPGRSEPKVVGWIVSPHEPRAAVVSRAWDQYLCYGNEVFLLHGAHLTGGFKSPPAPATPSGSP